MATRIVVSLVLVAALALAAPAGPAAAAEVKIGDLGIVADAPFYLAVEKGYFKERGIEVKLEKFTSAAQAMAPLATGELHVVGGGIGAGLFNAFARDWPVRIVAARSRDLPGFSSDTLVVRSDLKDKVRSFADLKGRKIAVNAPAAALVYMLGKMLETEGLTIKDVEIVYMPWPNMGPAFAQKAIDAGTMVEPFVTQFADRGHSVPFRRASEVLKSPPFEVSVVLFNKDWAEKNPKVAGDFAVAYLKAARLFHEAMHRGAARAEVVDVLTRYTRVKDKALYDRMQWGAVDPNGTVARESLKDQQEWHFRQGTVVKKVDVDEIVDERYFKHALDQLGTVPARRP
jgi:NitT/TauT family transport system substrate-binding protein